jgi:hypothetical protein
MRLQITGGEKHMRIELEVNVVFKESQSHAKISNTNKMEIDSSADPVPAFQTMF